MPKYLKRTYRITPEQDAHIKTKRWDRKYGSGDAFLRGLLEKDMKKNGGRDGGNTK